MITNNIDISSSVPVHISQDPITQSLYYAYGSGAPILLNPGAPITIHVTGLDQGQIVLDSDIAISDSNTYFISGNPFNPTQASGNFVFNGQGHTVTLTGAVNNYGGLFQCVSSDQSVTNVSVLADSGATLGTQGGAIAGTSAGNIDHCSSSIEISGDNAGGIVGRLVSGSISDCHSSGDITGNSSGGIVGSYAEAGTVVNCDSSGVIATTYGGGILGANAACVAGLVQVYRCHSTGDVLGDRAGGVAGFFSASDNESVLTISDCYSLASVISGFYAGGIVGGWAAGNGAGGTVNINRSFSIGSIDGFNAGGIVGSSAASDRGHVLIHQSYATGNVNGGNSGGIAAGSAGVNGGEVQLVDVYSTGGINGQFAGGIVGPSAAYNGGHVSLSNAFATGSITGSTTGGIFGDGIGLGLGTPVVFVDYAYTSGIGSLVHPNGIFSNLDANGSDNVARVDIGLLAEHNYSEANNGNSGVWTNANAIYTDAHPYGLISAGHSTLTDVWLIPPEANTAFSLAVFDSAPTLSSISTLPGNQVGAVYTLDFAHLLSASNATDSDGSVVAFQIDLNDSTGTFYSGASFNTATPVTVSALLDSTHNLYWRPNQAGVVTLGGAVAEDDLGAYSVGVGTPILVTVSGVPSNSSINLNGLNVTEQAISGSGSLGLGQGALNIIGNGLNCQGGAAQNNPLGVNNISNLCAGLFNNFSNSATILNQNISQFISTVTIKNGGFSNNYNCAYLADFQGSANIGIISHNSNPYITNCLNLINNQEPSQNIDLTNYQGMVIINNGINVTGVTHSNAIGMLGGSCTLGAGNQTVYLMGPNATVNGGSGISTVDMLGVSQNSINMMQQGNNVKVWSDWLGSGSGVTNLNNVDRIQLNDGMIALDTGAGESAGQVFRLYEAAFHRVGDQQGTGYWLNQMDLGTGLEGIANQFIGSQEFINLYGSNPSNSQFITALYQNVLGRAPDVAGLNYWLNSGLNKGQLLIQFAESPEGIAHVAGQTSQGVHYQQWVQ